MYNEIKIQDIVVQQGTKVHGFLKISDRPTQIHKVPLIIVNGIEDGPIIVINGGEHGSEYNGPAGCLKLIDKLDPMQIKGKIILVPVVNILGYEFRWMHGNPIDYRDLTSCYVEEIPKGGSGYPKHSFQLAAIFYNEVLSKSHFRLNLHGGDLEEDVMMGTMYNRIGNKKRDDKNLEMARNFGWKWIREGIKKNRTSIKGKQPRYMPMTVGTEAGGMGRCQIDIVDEVVKGCWNTLKYLGMIEGEPIIPKKANVFNPYHMYCNKGGFFISHVRSGDMVNEGDFLGEIRNFKGKIVEEIIVPTDGIVHMVTSPALWEGDVTYEIGTNIREID